MANAFLKAYALQCPISIELVDFYLGENAEVCAASLTGTLPDAVGFSIYLWNRDLCNEIAVNLRRSHPSVKLLCGGPEVTADPGFVMKAGIFDFVIAGEGEVPFLSLCNTFVTSGDFSNIPGIMFPGATVTQPLPPLNNLDSIPSPYLTKIIDTNSNPGILWQLSRGCSFTCDFCFDSSGMDGVRYFSLERVEAELRHFAVTGVSQVFVLDSTFNRNPKRAKKILKMIKNITPNIHFHFEVRNEFIDCDMADQFAQITCSLQIGLQSADRKVLGLVGRSFDKTDFSAKTGLLNESGAIFGFDLMYGLPGDTLAGFYRSMDYALSLYPNHLDIFPLAVLPGTRLASHGSALTLRWDNHPPYTLLESDSFSSSEMAAAAGLAAACDIFYTRGKAVAWFNAIVTFFSIKPSDLLQKFSHWLIENRGHCSKEIDYSDDDIWTMQQLFITHLFSNKKVKKFLPLVLDVITYHHHYASVLLASSPESHPPVNNRDSRFSLSPAVRIVHFTYNIGELLECGEPRIRWMYDNLSQSGSHAVIYVHDGMVCTETLDAPCISLLEKIRHEAMADFESENGLGNEETGVFLRLPCRRESLSLREYKSIQSAPQVNVQLKRSCILANILVYLFFL